MLIPPFARRPGGAGDLAPLALALTAILVAAPAAHAGRLLVTGHAADHGCSTTAQQCHFVQVATQYVRAGAPDPSKPLLVLDNGGLEVPTAIGHAYAPNPTPLMVVMDPSGPEFARTPLDVGSYSAIVIASDSSCGGCDLNQAGTADSDGIARRSGAIADFLGAGGGLYANAGGARGDGAGGAQDAYYRFLPVSPAPRGSGPFALTGAGTALGFLDDPANPAASDINCCASFNSFTFGPAGSQPGPAEIDREGRAETLIATGTIAGGGFHAPSLGSTAVAEPVAGTVRIKLPGGRGFGVLRAVADIPFGSTVDTTKGTVRLTSARDLAGDTQSAIFYAGRFVLRQARRARATTDLVLAGPAPKPCASAAGSSPAARGARRRAVKRTLWGRGKGAFRTDGRYSAATVRGTVWLTEERCTGTFTSVREGVVSVFDKARGKTVRLTAGRSYLAKPGRIRRR